MTLTDRKFCPIVWVCFFDVIRNPIGLIWGGLLRDPAANRRRGGCWVTRRSVGFFEENWRERLRTVNTEVIWEGTILCRTRCSAGRYIVCRLMAGTVDNVLLLNINSCKLLSTIYRDFINYFLLIRILKTLKTRVVARQCSHADMGQRSLLLTLLHRQVVLFQLSGLNGSTAKPAAGCPLWACVLLLWERNWMSRQSKDSQEPRSPMAWLSLQWDSQTWTHQCRSSRLSHQWLTATAGAVGSARCRRPITPPLQLHPPSQTQVKPWGSTKTLSFLWDIKLAFLNLLVLLC